MKTGLRPLSRTTATIMNHKRRQAVARAAQRHHQQRQQQQRRHGEEDHAQIGERERRRVARRAEQRAGSRATGTSRRSRSTIVTSTKRADGGAEDARAPRRRPCGPNAWPMRMVEAMPKPNTKAVSRNMTMLALDVAASASSPRKRPTQMALIVPFSDWRIEEASVGSAKASRVGPIGPASGRRACRRAAASPSSSQADPAAAQHARTRLPELAEPLQRRAQPFGLGGLLVMVGAGLLDRLGLGALGEVRIGERAARLSRSFSAAATRLRQARLLGVEVDHAFQREGDRSLRRPRSAPRRPPSERRQLDRLELAPAASSVAHAGRSSAIGRSSSDASSRTSVQLAPRRHVELGPRGADFADQLDQPVDLAPWRRGSTLRLAAPAIWRRSARTAARPSRSTVLR